MASHAGYRRASGRQPAAAPLDDGPPGGPRAAARYHRSAPYQGGRLGSEPRPVGTRPAQHASRAAGRTAGSPPAAAGYPWRSGIPASAGCVVALVFALVGGLVDALHDGVLSTLSTWTFVVGCVIAAAVVRRDRLPALVLMPPLVFLLTALVGGAVDNSTAVGSWPKQVLFDAATSVFTEAPAMLIAVALVLAVYGVRTLAARNRSRPAGAGYRGR